VSFSTEARDQIIKKVQGLLKECPNFFDADRCDMWCEFSYLCAEIVEGVTE